MSQRVEETPLSRSTTPGHAGKRFLRVTPLELVCNFEHVQLKFASNDLWSNGMHTEPLKYLPPV